MNTQNTTKQKVGRPRRRNLEGKKSTLARNIERRMEVLGIDHFSEVARISNVSRTVVTNIFMQPSKTITLGTAIKLASTLKCRAEWLLTGQGQESDDECALVPILPMMQPYILDVSNLRNTLELAKNTEYVRSINGYSAGGLAISIRDLNPATSPILSTLHRNGYLHFDLHKPPVPGELVLAYSTEGYMSVLEYFKVKNCFYLKEINSDVPISHAISKVDECLKPVAGFVGYSTYEL